MEAYRRIIILAIVVAIIVFGVYMYTRDSSLRYFVYEAGAMIAYTEDFVVQERHTRTLGDRKVDDYTFSDDLHHAKLRVFHDIDADLAESMITDSVLGIDSLFSPQDAPYPGVITERQVCPQEFIPSFFREESDGFFKASYEIYANDRFTYGLCSADLIAYDALLSYLYCEDVQTLLELELFYEHDVPHVSASEILKTFYCTT